MFLAADGEEIVLSNDVRRSENTCFPHFQVILTSLGLSLSRLFVNLKVIPLLHEQRGELSGAKPCGNLRLSLQV